MKKHKLKVILAAVPLLIFGSSLMSGCDQAPPHKEGEKFPPANIPQSYVDAMMKKRAEMNSAKPSPPPTNTVPPK